MSQNLFLIAQTDASTPTDPYQSGQYVGSAVVPLLMALLAAKWLGALKKPEVNRKAVLSLALMFMAMTVSGLTVLIKPMGLHPLFVLPLAFMAAGCVLAAFVLAILGLVDLAKTIEGRTKGRASAIWAICLSVLFLAIFITGAINGASRARGVASKGGIERNEEFNFVFDMPGNPWRRLKPEMFNKLAKLAMVRSGPESFMMMLPEKMSGFRLGLEAYADLALANLKSATDDSREIMREHRNLGLADGLWIETDATVRGMRIHYVHHFMATNGWAYQFIVWGSQNDREATRRAAKDMIPRLRIADSARRVAMPGNLRSEALELGVHLKLESGDWTPWPGVGKSLASAVLGAHLEPDAAMAVFAAPWNRTNVDQPLVSAGLLRNLNFDVRKNPPLARRWINAGSFQAEEFEFLRDAETGETFRYRLRTLVGTNHVYLVAVWANNQSTNRDAILRTGHELVAFTTRPQDLLAIPSVAPERRLPAAEVLNHIGLACYEAEQHEQAASSFAAALALAGDRAEPPLTENLITALSTGGEWAKALELLPEDGPVIRRKPRLFFKRAELLAANGQSAEALAAYAKAIESDQAAEEDFVRYIGLLSRRESPVTVLSAIRRYGEKHRSINIRILENIHLGRAEKHEEAVEHAAALVKENPYHLPSRQRQVGALLAAGRSRRPRASSRNDAATA